MSERIPPGREPLTRRPKVGQHVVYRSWFWDGWQYEFRWQTGRVEIVRKGEAVVRSRYGFERIVAHSDLFHVPRHWGKR